MRKFEVGKKYSMRSACDYDCVWTYKVIARTDATVTLQNERGEIKKCRINKKQAEYYGRESVFPLGKYSMCSCLDA